MDRGQRLDVPTLDEKSKAHHGDGTLSLPRQGGNPGEQSVSQNRIGGVGVRAERSFLHFDFPVDPPVAARIAKSGMSFCMREAIFLISSGRFFQTSALFTLGF